MHLLPIYVEKMVQICEYIAKSPGGSLCSEKRTPMTT